MFSEIFCRLLKEHNTNPLRLAKEIGVPKSIVYEWKNGEREPNLENTVKLSQYFGVSLEYLTGRKENTDSSEQELIIMLRAAKEISKDDHDKLLQSFKDNLGEYLRSKHPDDKKQDRS